MLRKLVRLVFGNAHVKLVALAIAIALWAYANGQLKEEVGIVVPLLISVPEQYQIVYQSHPKVQMRLSGPHYLVKRRQDEASQNYLRLSASLNPEDLTQGVMTLRVDPGWLNVPKGELAQMGVSSVQPQFVTLHVSRVVTRAVPVEVRISERPHAGYEVRGWSAVPSEVMVTGPALVVDAMETVKTQKVSVWDAQADVRRPMVPLVLQETLALEDGVSVEVALRADPAQVAVHVEVGGKKEERSLEDIPVHMLSPPDFPYLAEIDPAESHVSVVVSGLPQDIARLTPGSVRAYVDLTGLQEETFEGETALYKEPVRLLLPEDIPISAGTPEPRQVTIILKRRAP